MINVAFAWFATVFAYAMHRLVSEKKPVEQAENTEDNVVELVLIEGLTTGEELVYQLTVDQLVFDLRQRNIIVYLEQGEYYFKKHDGRRYRVSKIS